MSSFVCSDAHITTIARSFIADHRLRNPGLMLGELAESFGFLYADCAQALKWANALSVCARYNQPCELNPAAVVVAKHGAKLDAKPLELHKLTECLIYQCSEFDAADVSNDARFVAGVIRHLREHQRTLISRAAEQLPWAID